MVPRSTFMAIARAERNVVWDAFYFWVLQTLALRLPDLFRATWLGLRGSPSGGISQVLSIFVDELRTAAWVVLPVAVVLFLVAGRERRNPAVALDFGAAGSVLYAFLWLPYRLLILDGAWGRPIRPVALAFELLALLMVVAFTAYAAVVSRKATPVPPRQRKARGMLVIALLLAAGPVLDARWIAGHLALLKPVGSGDPAPDFTLSLADKPEASLQLSSLRGHVVVLDFWATWCPPCLSLMPTLHEVAEDLASRGVRFVGINSEGPDADRAAVRAFLGEHPSPYPTVLDDGTVAGRYGVLAIPHLVIIDRQGRIVKVVAGGASRVELEREIIAQL